MSFRLFVIGAARMRVRAAALPRTLRAAAVPRAGVGAERGGDGAAPAAQSEDGGDAETWKASPHRNETSTVNPSRSDFNIYSDAGRKRVAHAGRRGCY